VIESIEAVADVIVGAPTGAPEEERHDPRDVSPTRAKP
jgi:hypothetical protein